MTGAALLVGVGLSIVIFDFGLGSPVARLLPSAGARRAVTGFLFGSTGALIALSPLGKESGAHINPVVSLGFWLMGRLRARQLAWYVAAQLAGAVAGALPLLAWGAMGRSVAYGASLPCDGCGAAAALLGETATTFALIFGLFWFLRRPRLRRFAPALFPPLYGVMVWIEGPISGTSTNPARSFAPALVSGEWRGWWIYWLGPLAGALLAVAAHRWGSWRWPFVAVAKVHHFDHDPYGVFRRGAE